MHVIQEEQRYTWFVNLSRQIVIELEQHGGVVGVGFETTHLSAVGRIVEFLETVGAEEAGALGGQLVLQGHPARGEQSTDQAEFPLARVDGDDPGIIRE